MKNAPLNINKYLNPEEESKSQKLQNPVREQYDQIIGGQGRYSSMCDWFNYPANQGIADLETIQEKLDPIKKNYDSVVVIGVGGSYLGVRAIYELFKHQTNISMHFAGWHLSGLEFSQFLKEIEGKSPLLIVISKSGTTLEPAVHFRHLMEWMKDKYHNDYQKRVVIITDPEKGALRKFADDNDIINFSVPAGIGGRYSVLSPVGMVPLICGNIAVEKIMSGASIVYEEMIAKQYQQSMTDYISMRHMCWNSQRQVECMIFDEPAYEYFAGWWQQLFGESEGKNKKGLFPVTSLITKDLHSLGQFFQEGTPIFFETFVRFNSTPNNIEVKRLNGFADGYDSLVAKKFDQLNTVATDSTIKAHHENGHVPICEIIVNSLDEFSVGYMLSFFKVAAAVSAAMFDVDPFNQPGVEFYKKYMKEKLPQL